MLRKIKLYGKLAKFIGHRVLEADVATAAEAVRFLLWCPQRRFAFPKDQDVHQARSGNSL